MIIDWTYGDVYQYQSIGSQVQNWSVINTALTLEERVAALEALTANRCPAWVEYNPNW